MSNPKKAIFELKDVSKHYIPRRSMFQWIKGHKEHFVAVNNVSFTVEAGEIFAIIGESGSGKSTLGYMMAGMIPVTHGSITFHGKRVDDMRGEERLKFRRKVQMIFQDSASSLNPRRRVKTAVLDALRLSGVRREERHERMLELARLVGLSEGHLESYPHELSGGQRQRVSIARALSMQPEVLIADEPVSALDVSLQGQIVNLLMELREKFNLTIILISHDLAVVQSVSDRSAVMYGGRLVELGTTQEITGAPKYSYTRELLAAVPSGIPGSVANS